MSWRERAIPVDIPGGARPGGWRDRATPIQVSSQQELPQDKVRTVLDQGMQGATFAYADEPMDAIGAVIAKGSDLFRGKEDKLFKDQSLGQVYDEARSNSGDRLKQQVAQNPEYAIPSNILGALLTGGAGASTKIGGTVANSIRSGNAAARIAKGSAAGATSGGIYGAGAGEEGHRLESAGQGAAYGAAFGAALPAAGATVSSAYQGTKNAIKGATARNVDELEEVSAAIKKRSNDAYSQMRASGAVINRNRAANIANQVEAAIGSTGKINKDLHRNTISVLNDFKKSSKNGDFTIEELDQYRQLFKDVVNGNTDIAGKLNPDAFKAVKAIDTIDNLVDNLKPIDIRNGSVQAIEALKIGRSEYARKARFDAIANIIKKSNGDANYLKRELKKLADNPKKTRGFNPEELAALKQASTLSGGEGIMKMLGKFGFDLGGSRIGNTALPVIGGGAAAAASSTGMGAMVPVVGTVARQGQKYLARGKAEKLLDVIENGGQQGRPGSAYTPLGSVPAGELGGATYRDGQPDGTLNLPEVELPKINRRVPQTPPEPLKIEVTPPGKQSSIPKDIIESEGFRGRAYKDTVGKTTVGIGFNMDDPSSKTVWKMAGLNKSFADVKAGKAALTRQEAEQLASTSYQIASDDARRIYPNFKKLTRSQQEALINMSYQLGGNKLAMFGDANRAIRNGEIPKAIKHLKNSKWAKQTPNRAEMIFAMLEQ